MMLSKFKIKRSLALKLLSVLLTLSALPVLTIAINTLLEGYRISSTPQTIDVHEQCKVLSTTGAPDVFAPTKTAAEWQSFLDNPPPNVKIDPCQNLIVVGQGCGGDFSSQMNNYNGYFNAPFKSNSSAFAALKSDGSISAWGYAAAGGSGTSTDSGYVKIYSTVGAFAALKSDGSISAWGSSTTGGSGTPTDSGYVRINSNAYAFAALKSDGSIVVWGDPDNGGSGAPTDSGYIQINSTSSYRRAAFAALKSDGSIVAWGDQYVGGSGAPTDSGYVRIYSNRCGFVALKSDGSLSAWGCYSDSVPAIQDVLDVYSTAFAFAAIKSDGSIVAWGDANYGGSGAPTDSGYVKIYSNWGAFVAVKGDGSITAWGHPDFGGTGAPSVTGVVDIAATSHYYIVDDEAGRYTTEEEYGAFAALKDDGSIIAWGRGRYGETNAPTGTGFVKIYSSPCAFAALKSDGSIVSWGGSECGGSGAPTGAGFVKIYSTGYEDENFDWDPDYDFGIYWLEFKGAFAALKSDGSIVSWGDTNAGGSGAPTGTGFVDINTGDKTCPNAI